MTVVVVVVVVRMPAAASEKDEAIQARLGNSMPWSNTRLHYVQNFPRLAVND